MTSATTTTSVTSPHNSSNRMTLSDEQMRPVQSNADHKLVLAGPGTGKTLTILGFVKHLIVEKKVKPEVIQLVSFTRAVASDLRRRIKEELGEDAELPHVSTLHSFCLRQLMKNSSAISSLPKGFSIANDFEERYLIMEDIKSLIGAGHITDVFELFHRLASNWETLNADKSGWETTFENPGFLGAWQEHREIYGYLLRSELVYQLKRAVEIDPNLKTDDLQYLIVDEYQDLNKCDLAIIEFLRKKDTKVFCAGDDDQSIYGFRYAYPEGIRAFTKDVPGSQEFQLSECFRCDSDILALAMNVIGQDTKRIPKTLKSMSGTSGQWHLLRYPTQLEETQGIVSIVGSLLTKGLEPSDIIILLRSDSRGRFSNPIRDILRSRQIEINESATALHSLNNNNNGRYLLAVLKFFDNPQHDLALRTILQLTPGLGVVTFASIYDHARANKMRFHQVVDKIRTGEITTTKNHKKVKNIIDQLSSLGAKLKGSATVAEALQELKKIIPDYSNEFDTKVQEIVTNEKIESTDELIKFADELLGPVEAPDETSSGIRIMTMHQAKGLTARAVIVVAAEQEYIPGRDEIEESRRLLYVSLTRAKNFLFITYCQNRTGAQQHTGDLPEPTTRRTLTRFLRDLPLKVTDGPSFKLQ